MKPLAQCQLYAFVDAGYLAGRSPQTLAQMLCDGGADLIQWRAKDWPVDQVRQVAEDLMQIVEPAGVGLVINDHPAIAAQVGAQVCHLGQEDFFDAGLTHVRQIRDQLPPTRPPQGRLRFGLSSHAPDQARRALAADADYIAIGPVFPTGTKPKALPVTLEYVRWAARHVSIPWFAIGGITLDNLESVLAAGARRVCVVSAILTAPHPAQACQRFKERLLSARPDPVPNPNVRL